MGLDVTLYTLKYPKGLKEEPYVCEHFNDNYTHNCNTMASEAGIYMCVWRPSECGIEFAEDLIEPLSKGIELMESDPKRFMEFDPPNGWGSYKTFIPWLKRYLKACKEYPKALIEADR